MPSGNITLHVQRTKNKRLKVDTIFDRFRKNKILSLPAKIPQGEETRWRPKGLNSYEIRILSIKRVCEDPCYPKYEAECVLVGMNNEVGTFPTYFCWNHGGTKHACTFYFDTCQKFELQYREYLTL